MKALEINAILKYGVVAILLMVAVILFVPNIRDPDAEQQILQSKMALATYETALGMFKSDVGRFPSTKEGLGVLFNNKDNISSWQGPYLRREPTPVDTWFSETVYRNPGKCGSERGYDLYSTGANHIDECGSGDDLLP